ncbi:hypothetical protein ACLOJK_006019 [Asimina triloba]
MACAGTGKACCCLISSLGIPRDSSASLPALNYTADQTHGLDPYISSWTPLEPTKIFIDYAVAIVGTQCCCVDVSGAFDPDHQNKDVLWSDGLCGIRTHVLLSAILSHSSEFNVIRWANPGTDNQIIKDRKLMKNISTCGAASDRPRKADSGAGLGTPGTRPEERNPSAPASRKKARAHYWTSLASC